MTTANRIIVWSRDAYDSTANATIATLYYGLTDGTLFGTHTLGSDFYQYLVSPTGAKILALGTKEIHLIDVASDTHIQAAHSLSGPGLQFNQSDELYAYWIEYDADWAPTALKTALLDPSSLAFTNVTSGGLGDFYPAMDTTGTAACILGTTLYLNTGSSTLWTVDLATAKATALGTVGDPYLPFAFIDAERVGFIDSGGNMTVADYQGNVIASKPTAPTLNGGADYARLSADRSSLVYISYDGRVWVLNLTSYELASYAVWPQYSGYTTTVLDANTVTLNGQLLDLPTGKYRDFPWPWVYDGRDNLRAIQFDAMGATSDIAPAFWTGFVYTFETLGTLSGNAGGGNTGGGGGVTIQDWFEFNFDTITLQDFLNAQASIMNTGRFMLDSSTAVSGATSLLVDKRSDEEVSFQPLWAPAAGTSYSVSFNYLCASPDVWVIVSDTNGNQLWSGQGEAQMTSWNSFGTIVKDIGGVVISFGGAGYVYLDDVKAMIPQ